MPCEGKIGRFFRPEQHAFHLGWPAHDHRLPRNGRTCYPRTNLICYHLSMKSLKIILLCIVSAIVYGILHDQVTARVCVEYFTIGHAPIFNTESPTLLAFGWGIVATWWVGLILGILAALVSRLGSWPKLDAANLIRPIVILLIVMGISSLLVGIVGYEVAQAGILRLPEPLASRLPTTRQTPFFADWWAHQNAYGVGFIGGLVLCVWVLFRRRRMGRSLPSLDDASNLERRIITVLRWTARAIGTALLGLIAVFAVGEGVPNPLHESFRENLLGVGILTMLIGQVVAWKREGIGSLLILGGFVLFSIVNPGIRLNPSLVVVGPWLVTGLLYLICWWRTPTTVLGRGL